MKEETRQLLTDLQITLEDQENDITMLRDSNNRYVKQISELTKALQEVRKDKNFYERRYQESSDQHEVKNAEIAILKEKLREVVR